MYLYILYVTRMWFCHDQTNPLVSQFTAGRKREKCYWLACEYSRLSHVVAGANERRLYSQASYWRGSVSKVKNCDFGYENLRPRAAFATVARPSSLFFSIYTDLTASQ